MSAPAVDLTAPCATCGGGCPRSRHAWRGGQEYGGCQTHRRCQRFELDELAAVEPLLLAQTPDVDEPEGQLLIVAVPWKELGVVVGGDRVLDG